MHRIATSGLVALATVLGTAASAAVALPASAAPVPLAPAPSAAQFRLPAAGWAAHLRPAATGWTASASPAAATPADQLVGVSCVSATYCMATGANQNANSGRGAPLAETWKGSQWKTVTVKLPSGADGGALADVSCKSATFCVAVGQYQKGSSYYALAETWNGTTWTPSEPPAPGGGNTGLYGVSCVTAKSCVATGAYTTNNGNGAAPLAETFNGSKWTEHKPAVPSGAVVSQLVGVSCVSTASCVAVGFYFGNTSGGALAESWNGTAWSKMKVPSPSGSVDDALVGVSCTSGKRCTAVGFDATVSGSSGKLTGLAERWNGTAWAAVKVPWPTASGSSELTGVSCVSAARCVATGTSGINTNAAGGVNTGKAAAASWNGTSWTVKSVPAPAKGKASLFNGVTCRSATFCAAVGELGPASSSNGSGLSGFWNGTSWKLVTAI